MHKAVDDANVPASSCMRFPRTGNIASKSCGLSPWERSRAPLLGGLEALGLVLAPPKVVPQQAGAGVMQPSPPQEVPSSVGPTMVPCFVLLALFLGCFFLMPSLHL